MELTITLAVILLVAFLYSSVGHGGASGYLGMMVLMGMNPAFMRPSALLLNIIVAAIATWQFFRAGFFRRKLFLPFVILSIPFSFIGSKISLSDPVYKIILGVCLLMSVMRLLMMNNFNHPDRKKEVMLIPALVIGAGIGLVSGMIGIGGGVILSPLLLLFRWADIKESAAVAAPFILVNSLSGMAGLWSSGVGFQPGMVSWVVAAVVGGIAGSYWGSKMFNVVVLKYVLSVVLLIAAGKLFIG